MHYDLAIAGGGLGGLALAILSARAGFRTVLIEKHHYPLHRVCGEYIAMESWDFLEQLGLPLKEMHLPRIEKLQLSSPSGRLLTQPLAPGGFGISRFQLDARLAAIARDAGVEILENTRVTDIHRTEKQFKLQVAKESIMAKMAVGAFGKRSNLDIKWNRPFVGEKSGAHENYIGIKYHIEIDHPKDLIGLHLFENGYCGLSAVEDNRYCLCYLTRASQLRKYGSISVMEQELLSQNPVLKTILKQSVYRYKVPETISQISFKRKSQTEREVILIGDAAGLITPLCGNGMSMALRSAKMAFELISPFLRNEISSEYLHNQYAKAWNKEFGHRLRIGRLIQRWIDGPQRAEFIMRIFQNFPVLLEKLIANTHGKSF